MRADEMLTAGLTGALVLSLIALAFAVLMLTFGGA